MTKNAQLPEMVGIEQSIPGEMKLWTMVVLQAVNDILSPVGTRRERYMLRRDALSWVFADHYEIGGFLFVCQAIEADGRRLADKIRHYLAAWESANDRSN